MACLTPPRMLAERIEWYSACVNNDIEFIDQRLQLDSEIYEDTNRKLCEYNNIARKARTTGQQQPLVAPFTEKTRFLNVVDDRLTDFPRNIISGFTGLMYACYFDSCNVFEKLFRYEYRRTSVFEVNVHAAAKTKTSRFVLPIGSDCLMLALLRGSRNCLNYIKAQIREDRNVQQFFFQQMNRDRFNNLSMAALMSSSDEAAKFITARNVYNMIMSNADSQTGFFYTSCYYGQWDALEEIYNLLDDDKFAQKIERDRQNEKAQKRGAVYDSTGESGAGETADDEDGEGDTFYDRLLEEDSVERYNLRKKIYIAALTYAGEVSLLEACQKKIDYNNFCTSYDLKVKCYNMMATILQDALIALINYKEPKYDDLRNRWSSSNLKYYKLLISQNQDEVGDSTMSQPTDIENVEEITIKYVEPIEERLRKWFSCEDIRFIQQNLMELRRQIDEREQSYDNYIYKKFMLIHYALLFDSEDVFELIYQHERQINVLEDTKIRLQNQEIEVPRNTTVMQLAVLLNAQRCVSRFVANVNAKKWDYEECQINEQKETLLMTCCKVKNEAARAIWKCYEVISKELDYIEEENPRNNVFQKAVEYDNVFVLDTLVQLASNPEFTPIVFVIVLGYKGDMAQAGFESATIAKYLTRMSLNYIQKASSTDIDNIMENFLSKEQWEIKKRDWDLLQQCITQDFPRCETEEEERALAKKREELVIQQAEQQLFCLLSYQSQIFNSREENVDETDIPVKKVIWFDICFGGDQVKILAPMCLKYRDPRKTDVEDKVTFRNFTGLMYAVMGNNTQAINYLLKYEYMEKLLDDEQVMTKFGTFLLKKGATVLHLACAVSDDKNFKLIQQFYAAHSEFDTNLPAQTITALSIIFNRPLSTKQFEHDLLVDDNLLRFAIQNMSIEYVQKITSYLQNRRFKKAVTKNYLKVFQSNFEQVNCYDIAVESFYSNLDDVTIQIKALVKKTLKDIITDEDMDEEITVDIANWFVEPFEAQPGESDDNYMKRKNETGKVVISDLQQLKSPQEVLGDKRNQEDSIVNQGRSVVPSEDLSAMRSDMMRRTQLISKFNYNDQTELQTDWFNSCRGNNMDYVRRVSYMCTRTQDQRPTDLDQMIQHSFTGLMYAVVYGNPQVLTHVLQAEVNVLTTQAVMFEYNGTVFYVPKNSSALHLAVLVEKPDFIIKILEQDSSLFFQFNDVRVTPFQLMVQRGYMTQEFFNMFISNLTKYQFDQAIDSMFACSNKQFAEFLVYHHQTRIQEPLYELVFKKMKEKQGSNSGADYDENFEESCEDILLRLSDVAIQYAFQRLYKFRRDAELGIDNRGQTCVWEEYLREMYGSDSDFEAAYDEYVALKNFKDDGQIVIEEEKIIDAHMVIQNKRWILPTPQKKLLLTQKDRDLAEWFLLCRTESLDRVCEFQARMARKGLNVIGQQDSRNNCVDEEIYQGFTGLMYAVYNDNVDVVKYLLPFEGHISSGEKNVIKAKIVSYSSSGAQDSDEAAGSGEEGGNSMMKAYQIVGGQNSGSGNQGSSGNAGGSVEPSTEEFDYLTGRELNVVTLLLVRGAINTFNMLYHYDLDCNDIPAGLQDPSLDEAAQLSLNQLCLSLKLQLFDYANVFIYQQFRFDVLNKNVFTDLFNRQFDNNEKLISISILHKNVVFANNLNNLLLDEYDTLRYLECRLDFDARRKQWEYSRQKRISSIYQVVYDVFDCYLADYKPFNDESFNQLLKTCIKIGVQRYEDARMYRKLTQVFMLQDNQSKEDAQETLDREISEFVNDKLKSDVLVEGLIGEVIQHAYTVQEQWIQPGKEEEQPEESEQMISRMDEEAKGAWFDACSAGDMAFIRKHYDVYNRQVETRPFNMEENHYPGFCGLHYAVLNNRVEVVRLLFEAEGGMLTEGDAVIKAFGIGYDENFLLSAGSNALQIAILRDQKEAFDYVSGAALEANMLDLYLKPNSRGLDNMYVAGLCWRAECGRRALETPFCRQLLTRALRSDFSRQFQKSPVDNVQMSLSIYLAKYLSDLTRSNLDFKSKFYILILKHNMSKTYRDALNVFYGSEIEKQFILEWLNAIFEDAITHAVRNANEVQWEQLLKKNLGRDVEAVTKQLQRHGMLVVDRCEVEVDEVIKQEILNAKKTMYTRIGGDKPSRKQETSYNKSLTSTFMEGAAPKAAAAAGKTFLTKQQIEEKTRLMNEKLNNAKKPKWAQLEQMYAAIMAGSTSANLTIGGTSFQDQSLNI